MLNDIYNDVLHTVQVKPKSNRGKHDKLITCAYACSVYRLPLLILVRFKYIILWFKSLFFVSGTKKKEANNGERKIRPQF